MAAIITTGAIIAALTATAIAENIKLYQERKQRATELAAIRREGNAQFRRMLTAWQAERTAAA